MESNIRKNLNKFKNENFHFNYIKKNIFIFFVRLNLKEYFNFNLLRENNKEKSSYFNKNKNNNNNNTKQEIKFNLSLIFIYNLILSYIFLLQFDPVNANNLKNHNLHDSIYTYDLTNNKINKTNKKIFDSFEQTKTVLIENKKKFLYSEQEKEEDFNYFQDDYLNDNQIKSSKFINHKLALEQALEINNQKNLYDFSFLKNQLNKNKHKLRTAYDFESDEDDFIENLAPDQKSDLFNFFLSLELKNMSNINHTYPNTTFGLSTMSISLQPTTYHAHIQSKKLLNKICVFITALICLTGLIGNILSLKVFCSTKLPRTSSRVYLIALTISDGIFLITHFLDTTCKEIVDLWNIDFPINITDQKETMCRSFALLRYVCRAASPWIIVAFTLERFLVVIFPHHSSLIAKPLLAKRFICVIIFLAILISLYAPILSGVTQTLIPSMKKYSKKFESTKTIPFVSSPLLYNYFQQKYFKRSCDVLSGYRSIYLYLTFLYTTVVIILPLIIISVFNTILIARLYKSNDQWASAKLELHEQEMSYKEMRDKKLQLENLKVTWTLIIISASFILLTLPHMITYFVTNIISFEKSVQKHLYSAQKITELLYILNHSINFFLYVVTRNSFRRVLKEKLKCNCFNIRNYMLLNVNTVVIKTCQANVNTTNYGSSSNEPKSSLNHSNDLSNMNNKKIMLSKNLNTISNQNELQQSNVCLTDRLQPETYENYWNNFNKNISNQSESIVTVKNSKQLVKKNQPNLKLVALKK